MNMKTYYITTYEEHSYETTYAVDANSEEEAIRLFNEGDINIEEVDSNFIDTTHCEIVSIEEEDEKS